MKVVTILKHIFIPHHENDYKPHFFREAAVAFILFFSVFLLGASFGSSFFLQRTVLGATISSGVLIDLTNESRIAYNQAPLVRSEKLDQAAFLKGSDMAQKQYFSHDSPEGLTPWHWLREVGYTFLYAGENLAIDFTEAIDVREAWLNSPAHKANIVNVEFREIGIAVVEGVYQNNPTMYIVQMFGTPAYGLQEEKVTTVLANKDDAQDGAGGTEGVVKGELFTAVADSENKEMSSSTPSSTPQKEYEQIFVGKDTIVVKNTAAVAESEGASPKEYSTWYEKFIFHWSKYVDMILKIMVIIIALALIIMIVVEIRKQHVRHIVYASLLLLLLSLFVYINQSFF